MREFEHERALLLERSDTQAGTLKAREAEVAQAEQNIKAALTERLAEIEVEAAAYRVKAEGRNGELKDGLDRERMDSDSIRAAVHAKTKEIEQERASLMARSAELAETLIGRWEHTSSPQWDRPKDGSGIGWKLMTDPAMLPAPIDNKDPAQAPSRATEALHRIRWPNEAGDRLIDFLIPGASLVISDDELGPITRSWCERIKHAGRMRA